jgi:O-antigen/teichoic acid export membrane protein
MLQGALPPETRPAAPAYDTILWARTALSLLFIDSVYILHSRVDILMLGAMKGAAAAGIYNVANRGAELITFGLNSVNMVLAPTVASLYGQGEKERLQNILTISSRAVLLFSLPVTAVFLLFGGTFLGLFGSEFVAGSKALSILSVAQFINCAMGSVGVILIMTGHQKQAAIGVAVSAALNIALNVVLIPPYGIEGAAVATGTSIIAWNVIYMVWVIKKTGLHTTAAGKIGAWKKN